MRDRRDRSPDDAPHETDGENTSRVLSVSNHELSSGLSLNESGTNYAELFTRLQQLIDNATETIRDLRRENAALSGRVSQLDAYLQLQAGAIRNETELHNAAVRLEEVLESSDAVTILPAAPAEPRLSPTPLHRVHEPTPMPEPRHEVPASTYTTTWEMPRAVPPVSPVQRATVVMPVMSPSDESEAQEFPHVATIPPIRPAHVMPVTPPPVPESPVPFLRDDEETRDVLPVAVAAPAPEPLPEPVAPHVPLAAATSPARTPLASVADGASERYAGTYSLVVYPFTRFSDLGQFQSALQALVGIHDVQVRRFAQGTLEMRLSYDGVLPLPQALRGLPVRVEDMEEEEPNRLRVRLDLNSGP